MCPYFTTKSHSDWLFNFRSVIVGFGFFFLGSISDVWLQQHARSHSVAIMTDAALGLAAGLMVLFYERQQKQNIMRQLQVIRLMNHHVRNSLQVISFVAADSQQEDLMVEVRDAVERIEWALREVLPARRRDMENLVFPSTMMRARGSQGGLGC